MKNTHYYRQNRRNLKIETLKMKQTSENRFSLGKVEESVAIKITDVNEAHSDFHNIIGVIQVYYQVFLPNYYYLIILVLKINLL